MAENGEEGEELAGVGEGDGVDAAGEGLWGGGEEGVFVVVVAVRGSGAVVVRVVGCDCVLGDDGAGMGRWGLGSVGGGGGEEERLVGGWLEGLLREGGAHAVVDVDGDLQGDDDRGVQPGDEARAGGSARK